MNEELATGIKSGYVGASRDMQVIPMVMTGHHKAVCVAIAITGLTIVSVVWAAVEYQWSRERIDVRRLQLAVEQYTTPGN